MTDRRLYTELRERAWRWKLSPSEEAQLQDWLAAHPEDLADWEAETALNSSLAALPEAPVPSNFTARVLDAAQRAPKELGGVRPRWWPRLAWLPRVAFACVVLGLGLFSYHRMQESEHRELVRTVSVLSDVASVPSPEILKDFEAIQALDTPAADQELLRLLQ
jgi:ferric-dicitrate binding protein FerR (iron transport regulator)